MNLVSKSNGLWATLGRFGLATNYQITAVDVENKILTVAEDVSGVFAEDDDLLIDSGTGVGQVFTVVSAVYDVDHTDITVTRTPLGVDVGDTLCFTRVPTDEDNVAVTHDIPGSTTTEIACNDLDLSGAPAAMNFACSGDSTIAGTVICLPSGLQTTFTFGNKQVGLRGGPGATFQIAASGALKVLTENMEATEANLGLLEEPPFQVADGNGINYQGWITVDKIIGHPFLKGDGWLESETGIRISEYPDEGDRDFAQGDVGLYAPIIIVGIAAKDIRKGVADGTYCRGKGIPRPQAGARR